MDFILLLAVVACLLAKLNGGKLDSDQPSGQTFNLDLPGWISDAKCHQHVSECIPMPRDGNCFGVPYPDKQHATSRYFIGDSVNPFERMKQLEGLMKLPRCWELIRDMLCLALFPPCLSSKVRRISKEHCLSAQDACSFIVDAGMWPQELRECNDTDSNTSLYSENCSKTDFVKYSWSNSKSSCPRPLVRTDMEAGFQFGISNCGLNCSSHLIENEQRQLVQLVAFWSSIGCIGLSLITILIMIVTSGAYHPRLHVLFCALFSYLGIGFCWLIPNAFDLQNAISCHADGTIRMNEVQTNSKYRHFGCPAIASVLLGSVFSCSINIAIFGYCNYICYTNIAADARRIVASRRAWYQFIAWFPAILVVVIALSISKVDADGITGLCFIGNFSSYWRIGLVYVPLLVLLIIPLVLIIVGHARRKFRRRLDPLSLTTPLNSMTKKLIFFYVTLLICFMSSLALTLIDHFVLSSNEALRAFILCQIFPPNSNSDPCVMEPKLDVRWICAQIILQFIPVVFIVLFLWTSGIFAKPPKESNASKLFSKLCNKRVFRWRGRNKGQNGYVLNGDIGNAAKADELEALNPMKENVGADAAPVNSPGNRNRKQMTPTRSNGDSGNVDPPNGGLDRLQIKRIEHLRANNNKSARSARSIGRTSITPLTGSTSTLPADLFSNRSSYPDLGFPDLDNYPIQTAEQIKQAQFAALQQMAAFPMPFPYIPFPCYPPLGSGGFVPATYSPNSASDPRTLASVNLANNSSQSQGYSFPMPWMPWFPPPPFVSAPPFSKDLLTPAEAPTNAATNAEQNETAADCEAESSMVSETEDSDDSSIDEEEAEFVAHQLKQYSICDGGQQSSENE